jgi:hypothetical protein
MHCQQGGEVWAWNGLLDAFRRFSGGFEPFLGSVAHRSDRSRSPAWPVRVLALFRCCTLVWPVVLTGLTGQCWAIATTLFQVVSCMHSSRGSCIGSGGACMCAGGDICAFRALIGGLHSLLELCVVSNVWSCCPCLRGPRLVFFKWSCPLPSLAFDRLLKFLFIRLFSFSFLSCYYLWVLSMHSLRGRLRTMCGSRTDGLSLPCVMSDWQHCVDWFLAK